MAILGQRHDLRECADDLVFVEVWEVAPQIRESGAINALIDSGEKIGVAIGEFSLQEVDVFQPGLLVDLLSGEKDGRREDAESQEPGSTSSSSQSPHSVLLVRRKVGGPGVSRRRRSPAGRPRAGARRA